MASRDEIFTNKLFLNAVLPLIKVLARDVPSLAKKFELSIPTARTARWLPIS